MNKLVYVFRVLALPFAIGVILVGFIRALFMFVYAFMKYGGEWTTFTKEVNRHSILELMSFLNTFKNEYGADKSVSNGHGEQTV